MKRVITLIALSVLLVGSAVAQNEADTTKKKPGKFGSFMRKAGEVTTGINMSDEAFIMNPFKSLADVEFVGCYGNSASQTVKLVFTVKNKSSNKGGSFGEDYSSKAYDAQGKTYSISKPPSNSLPTGVTVRFEGPIIEKVLPSVTSFELIQLSWYLDAGNHGGKDNSKLEFRNIPIQWDVEE